MVKENKKIFPNIKPYYIILFACALSPLLFMNSNYVNNQRTKLKLFKEKSKNFNNKKITRCFRNRKRKRISFKSF